MPACQLFQNESNSVLTRRGWTLPEISVTQQDFNSFYGNFAETNKDIVKELLDYLISPKKNQTFKENCARHSSLDKLTKVNLHEDAFNTDQSLEPVIDEEEYLEKYLTDIKLEDVFDQETNLISETFLTHLSNTNTKVTFLSNKQFLESISLNEINRTLLLPKSVDLFTPTTPIVVQSSRKNEQDEFDVYLSSFHTPSFLKHGLQENGDFFTFPTDDLENKENIMYVDLVNDQLPLENYPNCVPNTNSLALSDTINPKTAPCEEAQRESVTVGESPATVTKRNQNQIERKRRVEQHFRFQKLRASIPTLPSKNKVSKISILKSAIAYIKELDTEEKKLEQCIEIEKRKFDFLTRKLSFLTRSN